MAQLPGYGDNTTWPITTFVTLDPQPVVEPVPWQTPCQRDGHDYEPRRVNKETGEVETVYCRKCGDSYPL